MEMQKLKIWDGNTSNANLLHCVVSVCNPTNALKFYSFLYY